ncbi:hypothetical protein Moror_10765 [Moniliophthora roreri MCA 2997]|uniref:F-box domain-containing protein n=1 Tax=Moniliophthora roreri (strain MCA 2997) TaxID=1381753 RepID=V2X5K0_MONRO|nr:hypothetical protein Moror_10765 [Moniliophthora roreri MCA 2997]
MDVNDTTPNAMQPFFRLPDELRLKVFRELVATSGSSAALLPPAGACRALRGFLVGEASLWTCVRVDSSLIDLGVNVLDAVGHPSGPGAVWPGVALLLHYSANRPLSLTITTLGVTINHINILIELLRTSFARCRSLVIHCFFWEHLVNIMSFLDDKVLGMNLLEFCDIQYFSSSPEFQTQTQLLNYPTTPGEIPNSPFHCSKRYPKREKTMFPALKTLRLQSFPHRWHRFYPHSLTSLSLGTLSQSDRPSWRNLKNILLGSRHTLVDLELTAVAAPKMRGRASERYTLTKLTRLRIGFTDPKELILLAASIDLPKLDSLSIEDIGRRIAQTECGHDSFFPDKEQFKTIQRDTLAGFEAVATYWPVQNITTLVMSHIAMYEMKGNMVSQLVEDHHTREDWEKNGIPFASEFFYKFKALTRLDLYHPDESTLMAAIYAPRYYDQASGSMKPLAPLFPLMKSYYIDYD